MTGKQVENYIVGDLNKVLRHDAEVLANAITNIAKEIDYDEFALMQLLIEDKPIDELHTHSYGFHTANGRSIINGIQNLYRQDVD
jgi:hypothetical protein